MLIIQILAAITVDSQIAVIYGNNPNDLNFFQASEQRIYLGLNILGSAFWVFSFFSGVYFMTEE